ncbi:hypothetical protein PGRAT_11755 [Paenibacillus graminis]|uniref:Uncharacterized protein n=1 Tax=Paenibacillus graminis TaxID=189425 RepID=A0A089M9L0_9BACL|nr:hypothetical protein PGRAT_11755 [Paenibacillus graminis]
MKLYCRNKLRNKISFRRQMLRFSTKKGSSREAHLEMTAAVPFAVILRKFAEIVSFLFEI